MPQFTEKTTIAHERLIGDQVALTGHTTLYDVYTAKVTGADRFNDQVQTLSGGLSAVTLPISPLSAATPAQLTILSTDQPVDMVLVASGVRLLMIAGSLSNIALNVLSNDTTIMLHVAGGSNASLQATFPLP